MLLGFEFGVGLGPALCSGAEEPGFSKVAVHVHVGLLFGDPEERPEVPAVCTPPVLEILDRAMADLRAADGDEGLGCASFEVSSPYGRSHESAKAKVPGSAPKREEGKSRRMSSLVGSVQIAGHGVA